MNYGTVLGFKTYHTARNTDITAFDDDAVIAGNLLVASEWIDATYRNSFSGLKTYDRNQIREWPRTGAVDIYDQVIGAGIVPAEVENATYEAALKHMLQPGALSKDWTPNEYKRASVDGAVSVEYMQYGSAGELQTRFKIIEEILSTIFCSRNLSSSLSGYTSLR